MTALGQLPGKAGAALAAGRDRADQHTVADLETCDARAEFFDHADRLMPDDKPGLDRIFSTHDYEGQCRRSW